MGAESTFALTPLLPTWLFAVAPTDPATYAAISILFLLAALLVCVIPTRMAMRVDPMTALRWE